MERQTVTIEEAAQVLGISRSLAYRQARTEGHLAGVPVIRISNRYRIGIAPLERLLNGLTPTPTDPAQTSPSDETHPSDDGDATPVPTDATTRQAFAPAVLPSPPGGWLGTGVATP